MECEFKANKKYRFMKTYFIITALFCCFAMTAFPQIPTVKSRKKGNIAILAGPLPGYNHNAIKKLANSLRKKKFGVTLLSARQACDDQILSTNSFFAFIIPNANVYPIKGYSALQVYAKHGGHIVFAGGPAFENSAWLFENKWETLADIKSKYKIKNPHLYFDLNKPSNYGWTRGSYNLANKSLWEVVDDLPEKGMKSLHFLCENFEGWDGYSTKKLDFTKFDALIRFTGRSAIVIGSHQMVTNDTKDIWFLPTGRVFLAEMLSTPQVVMVLTNPTDTIRLSFSLLNLREAIEHVLNEKL